MAQRLIEVILPVKKRPEVLQLLAEFDLKILWLQENQEQLAVRFVLSENTTGPVIDRLEQCFSGNKDFTLLIFPLSSVFPFPLEEPAKLKGTRGGKEQERQKKTSRISKEELYDEAAGAARLNLGFVMLTALSTLIAASGLIADNLITIIGAAMISPLLGPNVAFSLGVVMDDTRLIKKAAATVCFGVGITFILSLAIGSFFNLHLPSSFVTMGSVIVDLRNITVALAAGVAGALAFSTGISTALVGVVVAVALLPPLVRLGLLLGEFQWYAAWQAFLLAMVNLISINLTSIATLFVQGVRPFKKEKKGVQKGLASIIVWFFLLIMFASLMFVSHKSQEKEKEKGKLPGQYTFIK